jgi:hypothetical protein
MCIVVFDGQQSSIYDSNTQFLKENPSTVWILAYLRIFKNRILFLENWKIITSQAEF